MSIQVHCETCDKSLGVASYRTFSDQFDVPDGTLRARVGEAGQFMSMPSDGYLCDYLCLAEWAVEQDSDE